MTYTGAPSSGKAEMGGSLGLLASQPSLMGIPRPHLVSRNKVDGSWGTAPRLYSGLHVQVHTLTHASTQPPPHRCSLNVHTGVAAMHTQILEFHMSLEKKHRIYVCSGNSLYAMHIISYSLTKMIRCGESSCLNIGLCVYE